MNRSSYPEEPGEKESSPSATEKTPPTTRAVLVVPFIEIFALVPGLRLN